MTIEETVKSFIEDVNAEFGSDLAIDSQGEVVIQILGLLAGVAIELHYGLPMSTYLLIMAISAASIGACLISAVVLSEAWEGDGWLLGTVLIVIGAFVFGTILMIAIGGAITQVIMGALG